MQSRSIATRGYLDRLPSYGLLIRNPIMQTLAIAFSELYHHPVLTYSDRKHERNIYDVVGILHPQELKLSVPIYDHNF
jgi:hypothetical protein